MSDRLILALDQGTTNTKAIVLDAEGRVRASASERVAIEFPQPGWAETDARSLWRSAENVIIACLDALDVSLGDGHSDGHSDGVVDTIALANQRESVVVWERSSGKPLGPVVSWQCTRGAARCEALATPANQQLVAERTGLVLDPMFSAAKLSWLLDSVPGGRTRAGAGELCAGTVDSWLLWHLTGSHLTDMTNASRTLLCSRTTGDWDSDLLAMFGIDASLMAPIRPSGDHYGDVRLRHPRLHANAEVGAVLGDSHAALLGHGAMYPGEVKASFGTGTSVMAPVEGMVDESTLSSTIAWSQRTATNVEVVRALEGNIYATGAALEWTAELLGLGGDVVRLESLARSADGSDGVMFVPAFAGLGAPHWDPNARGTVVGLTRHAGPAQVARAAFESVAHQVADVVERLTEVGVTPTLIYADGGAMRSELLSTTVADLIGIPLACSEQSELAAVGAAHLAGAQTGIWSDLSRARELPHPSVRVEPTMSDQARHAERERWRSAIVQTRYRRSDDT